MLQYKKQLESIIFFFDIIGRIISFWRKGYRSLPLCIVLILKMSNSSNSYEGPNLTCYRFSKGRKWKRKYTTWNVRMLQPMKFPEKKYQSLCCVNVK